MEIIKIEVEKNLKNNTRLDFYLSSHFSDITRTKAQQLIKEGKVKVNGSLIYKSSYIIKISDLIEFEDSNKETFFEPIPQNLPINIVYEDDDILVINKKRGMVVHPGAGNSDNTLVNALLYHCPALSTLNEDPYRPGIVHRLDKNTTGLLIVAKNNVAHQALSLQFLNYEITRKYIALVDGNMKNEIGIIEKPIARHKYNRKIMTTNIVGKYAKTAYEVIEVFKRYTLISLTLITGRTHQIRVHCKSIGHPIVGDVEYKGSNKFSLTGQLLHSQLISFVHPTKKIEMTFESSLPDDFLNVLEKLRK